MTLIEWRKSSLELIKALRDRGEEKAFRRLLSDLYPDKAHFIYELFQNAEDAKAELCCFRLTESELLFEHNGERLFSSNDVKAITSFGNSTKRDDPTNIGKFGVGFKAVFAYTDTPEINSGDYHFQIHDLLVPELENLPERVAANGRTQFFLPFNNPNKPAQQALSEIEKLLKTLDAATLLFLTHIRKIEYYLPDSSLGYIERIDLGDSRFEIRVQHPDEIAPSSAWFLKFGKEVTVEDEDAEDENNNIKTCHIALAFEMSPIEAKADSKKQRNDNSITEPLQWELVPIEPGRVCIYFPAEKEPYNLRFHIHAPFASTVARDSVRDCVGNKILRNHLAELLAQSMHQIRDQGLLSVHSLALLPNDKDNLSEFDKPFMSRLIQEFKEQELVPMKNGGYAPADSIFRGQRTLSDLIADNDLVTILGDEYCAPMWVANPSQRNQREDNFLSMLKIEQWSIADLAKVLGEMIREVRAVWMQSKDEKWHQELYELLMEYLNSAPKFPFTELKKRMNSIIDIDLVRCSDGTYHKGYECYFSSNEVDDALFPRVEKGVYTTDNGVNQTVYNFLEAVGVREIDAVAIVERVILPKYATELPTIPFNEHMRDISTIEKAYSTNSQEQKKLLRKRLLDTPFIRTENSDNGDETYKRPSELYFKTKDLVCYFSDNFDSFVYRQYPDSVIALCKDLGVQDVVKIIRKPSYGNNKFVDIEDIHGKHKRGLNGFDLNIHVDGLKNALASLTLKKSQFIWNHIVISHYECIRGVIESSSTQSYSYNTSKEDSISEFGHLLIDTPWLPDKNGTWRKPAELFLFDLQEEYDSISVQAKEVADKLGMKKQISFETIKALGFQNEEELERARAIVRIPQRLRAFEQFEKEQQRKQDETNPKRALPDKQSPNPERREEKVAEEARNTPDKSKAIKPRTVDTDYGEAQSDTRTYLSDQYTDDGVMFCQLCQAPQPVMLNGEAHFEAVTCVKDINAHHKPNNLALCPNHAAMYKKGGLASNDIYQLLLNCKEQKIPLNLAGNEVELYFTKQHLADLQTTLKAVEPPARLKDDSQ